MLGVIGALINTLFACRPDSADAQECSSSSGNPEPLIQTMPVPDTETNNSILMAAAPAQSNQQGTGSGNASSAAASASDVFSQNGGLQGSPSPHQSASELKSDGSSLTIPPMVMHGVSSSQATAGGTVESNPQPESRNGIGEHCTEEHSDQDSGVSSARPTSLAQSEEHSGAESATPEALSPVHKAKAQDFSSDQPDTPSRTSNNKADGFQRIIAHGFLNAKTATKEELDLLLSSSNSTLAGTPTDSAELDSLNGSGTSLTEGSPNPVARRFARSAVSGSDHLDSPSDPLPSPDGMNEPPDSGSGSGLASHSSTLSVHTEQHEEQLWGDALSTASSEMLTSITAAVEASQRRLSWGQTDSSEGPSGACSPTEGLINPASRKLPAAASEDQHASRLQAKAEMSVGKSISSKTLREALRDAKDSSILDASSKLDCQSKLELESEVSLRHQARLAELDSLLSTSLHLSEDFLLSPKAHAELPSPLSDFPSDWEFVQGNLSSRMQAQKRCCGSRSSKNKDRLYAITSRSTDSLEDLVGEIESHPIENWQEAGLIPDLPSSASPKSEVHPHPQSRS